VSDPESEEQQSAEARGRVDWVSVAYIVGGIPAIVAYIVLSFVLARFFNFPA
jgi:hypothetical protein